MKFSLAFLLKRISRIISLTYFKLSSRSNLLPASQQHSHGVGVTIQLISLQQPINISITGQLLTDVDSLRRHSKRTFAVRLEDDFVISFNVTAEYL